ncbi:MAG: MBL fold metallo-hydrolase, partial [Planctomycetota bacterium]
LVDTGTGERSSIEHVFGGLKTVSTEFGERVGVGDIERILITHSHIDHCGGLREILEHARAEVAVHSLDRRFLTAYNERAALINSALDHFLSRAGVSPERRPEVLRAFGYSTNRVRSVPVHRTLDDEQPWDGFRPIHTPGHSPGHVCLLIDDVLLAGDHVLARTIPQQWPESVAAYTGLGHYLDSLEKLRRIEGIRLSLGGHEPPVRDLARRIDEIRQTHHRRLDRLLDVLRHASGPLTIDQLTERMYSRQEGFRAMLALSDVGSRIEYLDQRGHLAVVNWDEIERRYDVAYRYRPA